MDLVLSGLPLESVLAMDMLTFSGAVKCCRVARNRRLVMEGNNIRAANLADEKGWTSWTRSLGKSEDTVKSDTTAFLGRFSQGM